MRVYYTSTNFQRLFDWWSTVSVWRNYEILDANAAWDQPTLISHNSYNVASEINMNQWPALDDYWLWDQFNTKGESVQRPSLKRDLAKSNFENYKQLRKAAIQSNPEITKEEIYEELLKPFQHEKVKIWDQSLSRFKISYICRYDGWDKEFTKTWNMLDHVRMHEGIKPHTCQIWGDAFTQKGNLKKHNLIQHSSKSLKERKKFQCSFCNRRYTERYNLMVKLDDYFNTLIICTIINYRIITCNFISF